MENIGKELEEVQVFKASKSYGNLYGEKVVESTIVGVEQQMLAKEEEEDETSLYHKEDEGLSTNIMSSFASSD